MFYSVLIKYTFQNGRSTGSRITFLTDVETLEEIKNSVVVPYFKGEAFWVNGVELCRKNIEQLRIIESEQTNKEILLRKQAKLNSRELFARVIYTYKPQDVFNDTEFVKDITDTVMKDVRMNMISTNEPTKAINETTAKTNNRVFIVHGRDDAMKTNVARFLEKLCLEPIILHEQPNHGQTLIEKIEEHINSAGYGIVLYTPCDKGGLADDKNEDLKFRARQNVVFEHGYLIGKLGREKVCALMKNDVEYPNDISGILYVKYQENDTWKLELAREMKKAGLNVDMNMLFDN